MSASVSPEHSHSCWCEPGLKLFSCCSAVAKGSGHAGDTGPQSLQDLLSGPSPAALAASFVLQAPAKAVEGFFFFIGVKYFWNLCIVFFFIICIFHELKIFFSLMKSLCLDSRLFWYQSKLIFIL